MSPDGTANPLLAQCNIATAGNFLFAKLTSQELQRWLFELLFTAVCGALTLLCEGGAMLCLGVHKC